MKALAEVLLHHSHAREDAVGLLNSEYRPE